MMRVVWAAALLCAGCSADPALGGETQGCAQGQCLGELVCLSDLCVDPQWEPEPATTGTGDDPEPVDSEDGGDVSDTGEGETSAGETGAGETSGSSDASTSDDGAAGCGSVDVLVVIDNSASMLEEQARVHAALPTLFDTLEAATGTSDHHVLVADTDAWLFAGCEAALCPLFGNCAVVWPEYQCGVTQPLVCEDVLGAGVTQPRGLDAANADCGFGAQRFANLAELGARDRLACAAQVGTSGGPEQLADAVLAATDARGAAAGCNEGFLRPDHPLLVVFVTDEDDSPANEGSSGSPESWHAALVQRRAAPVAVLGVMSDLGRPGSACTNEDPNSPAGAELSPRLTAFVEAFGERGRIASVCASDYVPAFEGVAELLVASCGG
ncbi:MAG: hypothetical protein AAGA54_11370 [Myxococcota bacterium]